MLKLSANTRYLPTIFNNFSLEEANNYFYKSGVSAGCCRGIYDIVSGEIKCCVQRVSRPVSATAAINPSPSRRHQ